MQSVESEIVIPFKYKSGLKVSLIFLCVLFVCCVGMFIYVIIMASQIQVRAPFPDAQQMSRLLIVFGCGALGLLLLLYGVLFASLIRKWRAPTQELRISQEGISFSSVLLRWEEIVTIFPYTLDYFGQHSALGIIPRDPDVYINRVIELHARNVWQKHRFHFLLRINARLSRQLTNHAPINILQKTIPLSIDELLTAIQEQFADFLQKNHITVLQWQN